ncbi:MAG TPA: hypothetical protein P5134_00375 [Bacteroidales bacterium]|nr:hypothetical protein [Bacteroidales bacterium]
MLFSIFYCNTQNFGRVRRLGGKPARAEAAGDAAAKKRACKLFLQHCVPTACDRGLGTGRRPLSASERGHALIFIIDKIVISNYL